MQATDCLEEFKVECNLRRLSPQTIKSYYNSTALFLNYLKNHSKLTELESISHQHIKLYVQYLISKKLSPSYINGILKCLRAFFKYACTEEYIATNPATKVSWQREGTVLIETFTDNEVRSLLDTFDFSSYLSARNKLILAIAFDTGARNTEICSIMESDIRDGINGHLRQKGKIAELALGYGGSVGALKAMGAIEMGLTEDELPSLVDAWRQANPKIVEFWWAVDRAVMEAVKYKHTTSLYRLTFSCRSGMLFITLPSGRKLAYVKPKVGINKFGGECITYEGVGATKKWERLDSYGPKFVENIVQATARDILCYAMQTLRCCSIVMHIHDEVVIEADPRMSLEAVCEQMGRTPPWAKGLLLRADGYTTTFYKKD